MVTRIGMIGLSEGNGHPFSFSSIINGYSDEGLKKSGWNVIYDYVKLRDCSEFGISDAKVTHAWTQDINLTNKLCEACLIPNPIINLEEMIGEVDAVIIARDDHENHFDMAMPFLKAGINVFIDKPLSIELEQLKVFKPYLETGQLMSCSGMRYARELDDVRNSISEYGEIKLIRGTVLNSWEKYGVHLIDAIFNFIDKKPVDISFLEANHSSFVIKLSDNSIIQLDAMGDIPKCFKVDIYGSKKISSHEISDNFSMFRRTLWHFINSIEKKSVAIPPHNTLDVMKILMAGIISRREGRKVYLDEFQL